MIYLFQGRHVINFFKAFIVKTFRIYQFNWVTEQKIRLTDHYNVFTLTISEFREISTFLYVIKCCSIWLKFYEKRFNKHSN